MPSELEREQVYVDRVYTRLDEVARRARESAASAAVTLEEGRGHEWRMVRQAMVRAGLGRAATLDEGGEAIVFGRLDFRRDDPVYVARVGIVDESRDPLCVDWRAPVAAAFYRATPSDPMDVVRRRHLLCRARLVLQLQDELLAEAPTDLELVGEAALLAALGKARTGRMRDIVATIQAAQDEIVRAPIEGVVVVQGGPGTGKTAVALHRVAYLLYTYRGKFERQGVLVVGPSAVFLRYIEQVLPSLGEQSAVLTTTSELAFGGVVQPEDPRVERLKGELRMAGVIRRAVEQRERVPSKPLQVFYDTEMLTLQPNEVTKLVDAVRRVPGVHNAKRPLFRRLVLGHLYRRYLVEVDHATQAGARGKPYTGDADDDPFDVPYIEGETDSPIPLPDESSFLRAVATDSYVRDALDEMWPVLTGEQLVGDLLASRERLGELLDSPEVELLHRDQGAPWTEADAPLVDEATVLLGPVPQQRVEREPLVADEELYFIDRVVEDIREIGSFDAHLAVDAKVLSDIKALLVEERLALEDDDRTPEPRETFGHVIVDEAQDLSPMQWRMIARRCPSASMTVLGDMGQSGRPGAATSWDEVLGGFKALGTPEAPPAVGGRYQRPIEAAVYELEVNYRTPAETMELAQRVLRVAAPDVRPPRNVRTGGPPPVSIRVARSKVAAKAIRAARERLDAGRAAVIAPARFLQPLREALGLAGATSESLLDAPVTALSPLEAKGLEFDVVVVVEPAQIVEEHGLRTLYVALTRTTRALVLVHSDPLPDVLSLGATRRTA